MKLETNNLNAEFYLASLALGILEAMKQGVVHPEIGVWSLGRLECSQQFEDAPVLSDDLKYVIGCMDEITTWAELDPQNCFDRQQKMIDELKSKCLNILSNLDYESMGLRILLSMDDHDLDIED